MILLHYGVPISGTNPFRSKERLVTEFVAPALRLPAVKSRCRQFYASKQAAEVWLNVFLMPGQEQHVIVAIRPLAARFGLSDPTPDNTDDILSSDCTAYRKLLTNATRYAIDLLLQADLVAEQQLLICIACRTSDPRDELKAHLRSHSPSYRSDWVWTRSRFWKGFCVPGPRSNFSAPGHWIWNLVLGIDYGTFPWPTPAAAAHQIGIPAPTC